MSREHHAALVLARHASECVDPAGVREQVLHQWHREIASHFSAEEQILLPALVAAGAQAPADLALRQHARLRELARRLDVGDTTALKAWGEAMREHVRFEERELFPLAERILQLGALRFNFHSAPEGSEHG